MNRNELLCVIAIIIVVVCVIFVNDVESFSGGSSSLPACIDRDENAKTIYNMLLNVKLIDIPEVGEIFSIYSRILCLTADLENGSEFTKTIPHGGFDNATARDYVVACQRSAITEIAIRDQIDIWRNRLTVLWETVFNKFPEQTLLDKGTYFRLSDTLLFNSADKIIGNCKFLDGARSEGESYALRLTRRLDNQRELTRDSNISTSCDDYSKPVVIANMPILCHNMGDNAGAYMGGSPLSWYNSDRSSIPKNPCEDLIMRASALKIRESGV